MLKFFFCVLLLLNAGLFALQRGYLDGIYSEGREPGRLGNQLEADKIKLLPATEPGGRSSAPTPAVAASDPAPARPASSATAPAAPAATVLACTEIGNFGAAEARRFASQLAEFMPTISSRRRDVPEVASYMVYLPSLGSKDAADKKAEELRDLGITDFFVVQDAPSIHYGISLGIFKTEEAANTQVAKLAKKGLDGTRVAARNAAAGKVAFQLRALNAEAKAEFDKIKVGFPRQEIRSCG